MYQCMTHYIAVIHKDGNSAYGVSFPDVPGIHAAGDSLDEVIAQAREALSFAAEDWLELTGEPFPRPRTLDQLREDNHFLTDSAGAVLAAIPLRGHALAAE